MISKYDWPSSKSVLHSSPSVGFDWQHRRRAGMANTANWRPDDNVVPTGGALQTPDSNRLCGNETTIGVSDHMDPNPDYDASDELEYAVSWFAWILRGVYPPPAYPPT